MQFQRDISSWRGVGFAIGDASGFIFIFEGAVI